MSGQYFISYSRIDGGKIAIKLADQLAAGPPSIEVWLDQRRLQPSADWDEQLVKALGACDGLLYVMTKDSISPRSECKKEWTRALKYKKPVIPLFFDREAELPFRLEPREYIDFTRSYEQGLARLREHVQWRATPAGVLHTLEERLEDARRDLARADATEVLRIEDEIAQLEHQIGEQRRIIADPQLAEQRTDKSIRIRLKHQRDEEPIQPHPKVRFINSPPMVTPAWFQNRHIETKMIGDCLRDDAVRMVTVVGRGGVGKTAMACRLLKALEQGRLPDDYGALNVNGIVYLNGTSLAAQTLSFPSLFLSLCKLLPQDTATGLEELYKDPQHTPEGRMRSLLEAFPTEPTVVLLDNFESVVDSETQTIKDGELDQALRTVLRAPQHGVKIIITTQVPPRSLLLTEPGRQQRLDLDKGLEDPFAANILRALDRDGRLGLKSASDALLARAREQTQGYPRALEALAGILSADRDTLLAEILADTACVLPENVVEVLVGEAFNRLDITAQQVMQALAVYRAPVPSVAVDYLLQPYKIGVNSTPVLARLVNMHFVRRDAGRYFLHQIDLSYAFRSIAKGDPADHAREHPLFTQHALLRRAADYFKETRKPRESWKRLDDLMPCLAEFELRSAGEDHDTAATVLVEIEHCLRTWGYYGLLVNLFERVRGKLIDDRLKLAILLGPARSYCRIGQHQSALPLFQDALALARSTRNRVDEASVELGLGDCSRSEGDCPTAIVHYENALAIANEGEDRGNAAAALGSLATIMYDLGQIKKSVEFGRKASTIAREIGDRRSECMHLFNLGCAFNHDGQIEEARYCYSQAGEIADELGYELIRAASRIGLGDLLNFEERWSEAAHFLQGVVSLADEINFAQAQIEARLCLSQALLGMDDLPRAEIAINEAGQYTFRLCTPKVYALQGVIALRQADLGDACEAFQEAIAQTDELLQYSQSIWNAIYTKALALAGLALCKDAGLVRAAAETYRQARAISSNLGILKGALHELDALLKADPKGVLKPVRSVLAGKTTLPRRHAGTREHRRG